MATQSNSSETAPTVAIKSVTLVSSYEPITVVDQHGNDYICLNIYEASQVWGMFQKLVNDGRTRDYNTGDWWTDLPDKLGKWLNEEQLNDLVNKDRKLTQEPSNPQSEGGKMTNQQILEEAIQKAIITLLKPL